MDKPISETLLSSDHPNTTTGALENPARISKVTCMRCDPPVIFEGDDAFQKAKEHKNTAHNHGYE